MASLAQCRTALKDTIENAVTTLSGYEVVPESINVPAFIIKPGSTEFNQAFGRGLDTFNFDVIVLVSRRDDGLAQYDLDDYVTGAGANSVRQAVWNNRDLGIDVEATITAMTDYGADFTVGGIDYVGARLSAQVLTSGTA